MAAPMASRKLQETLKLLPNIFKTCQVGQSNRCRSLRYCSHNTNAGGSGAESEMTSCSGAEGEVTSWLGLETGGRLAYRRARGGGEAVPGPGVGPRPGAGPGVVFCPGFQSHMNGTKAMALEAYCRRRGHPFVRFDYAGCGESDGDVRHVTLSDWKSNVVAVLDELTVGPQVLVGSSMGLWLSVMAALLRPHRVHAVLGIAGAPDFTQRAVKRFPPEALAELADSGQTTLDSEYGQYVVTQHFLDDAASQSLLTGDPVPLTCPLVLLHGMRDRSVPYELSLHLAEKVTGEDVRVVLRKAGDHRLSTPEDLQVIFEELERLLCASPQPSTPPLQSTL